MQEPSSAWPRPDGAITAILAIDLQRDFCAGGSLAVPDGDRVIPIMNRVLDAAYARGSACYATRDWHPPNSRHFEPHGQWPVHCVAGSAGARFHRDLRLPVGAALVSKGTTATNDGYSAFEGYLDEAHGTVLQKDLSERGVTHLVTGGLATDYCVRATVLDAVARGFHVTVIEDGIAAVDRTPGDGQRALDEMRAAGAAIIHSTSL